jgi:hypothetical protein
MKLSRLKQWFVGTPIATAQAHHERLGKITGLAVFASDNLSSVAYATGRSCAFCSSPGWERWPSPSPSVSASPR